MEHKLLSNSPICHMTANTFPQLPNPSVVTLTANQHFAVNRWNTNFSAIPPTPSSAASGGSNPGTEAATKLAKAPTQSPSYAETQPQPSSPGNLPKRQPNHQVMLK